MNKAQLEALIQREADKNSLIVAERFSHVSDERISRHDVSKTAELSYTAGASLLLQPLLEAIGALEKITDMNGEQWMYEKEADQALQRIKELLGEK